jgi:hypothetical protein
LYLKLSLESIKRSLVVAESSSNQAWYGWAFEAFMNRLANLNQGSIQLFPYAVAGGGRRRTDSGDGRTIVFNEIDQFVCEGHNLHESKEVLTAHAGPGLYWCPQYAQHPAVDAVLFLESTRTVYYLQCTVSANHHFSHARVKETHSAIVSLPWLKDEGWTFAYVVVVPSKKHVDEFKNKNSNEEPKIKELPAENVYVGYISESSTTTFNEKRMN